MSLASPTLSISSEWKSSVCVWTRKTLNDEILCCLAICFYIKSTAFNHSKINNHVVVYLFFFFFQSCKIGDHLNGILRIDISRRVKNVYSKIANTIRSFIWMLSQYPRSKRGQYGTECECEKWPFDDYSFCENRIVYRHSPHIMGKLKMLWANKSNEKWMLLILSLDTSDRRWSVRNKRNEARHNFKHIHRKTSINLPTNERMAETTSHHERNERMGNIRIEKKKNGVEKIVLCWVTCVCLK